VAERSFRPADAEAELARVRAQWETLAEEDPLWAVLTDPDKEHGRWDRDDFFRTGEREIATVLARVSDVGHRPDFTGEALDFGCGVGRLTAALSNRFSQAHGVDLSAEMVAQARSLTHGPIYHHNTSADLRLFEDGRIAFVYSSITLQHCPVAAAKAYIGEFVRVLAPGGICVMQIPEHRRRDPLKVVLTDQLHAVRGSLAIRTRLRGLASGAPARPRRPADQRMEMNTIPQREVEQLIQRCGGRLVDIIWTNSADFAFNGEVRYSEQPSAHKWASRQYTLLRP
jgi:SAM-dependent methyltransferase